MSVNQPQSDAERLLRMSESARAWLFEAAAPKWITADQDCEDLFPEKFAPDGTALQSDRRLFVQARHIYSFCELGRLGWQGPWRDRVERSMKYLLNQGKRRDGLFIHSFSHHGAPSKTHAELYDQAFILYALAQVGDAAGSGVYFDAADDLMDALEDTRRHPRGGFIESETTGQPRAQNPHMHLLEAFLSLAGLSGRPRWSALVAETAELCRNSFIDAGSGALLEFFSDDWTALAGDLGKIVEPGHCFEWAWLWERIGSGHKSAFQTSDGLVQFARAHGSNAAIGLTLNEVYLDGNWRNGGARLWPQTERLKAALARYRRTGQRAELADAQTAYDGLQRFLTSLCPGTWRDKISADGVWVQEPAPGSSFYHITCALSELIRTPAGKAAP
jgi:mannose/cellobiose epimerase-like protein (N-acyl-D-glucosamine 2-epimerase family)